MAPFGYRPQVSSEGLARVFVPRTGWISKRVLSSEPGMHGRHAHELGAFKAERHATHAARTQRNAAEILEALGPGGLLAVASGAVVGLSEEVKNV